MQRSLVNMVYVGALAQMFGIPLDKAAEALAVELNGRHSPVTQNMVVVQTVYTWTAEHIAKADPYHVAPMPKSSHQLSWLLLAELYHLGETPLAHLVEEAVRPSPQA